MQQTTFWKKYMTNAQLDLSIARYTKVPITWAEDSYVPEFNKLYFIMEGEGFVKTNGKIYYPKPGDLYLLPAGSTQAYGTLNDHNTFGKYWCHFSSKVNDAHLFQIIQAPVFVKPRDPELLIQKFKQLIFYSEKGDLSSGFRIHSILLEIMADFIEQSQDIQFDSRTVPSFEKMDKILQYIESHLHDSLSVEELARIASFHPNYFISVFKKYTGLSPIQFINRQRIERAKHLLLFTDQSVSAIADSLGMEVSYFSRMFREQIGFSPKNYREMISRSGATNTKKKLRMDTEPDYFKDKTDLPE
ncbi:AraC family transcriptional regulator [Fictibacillus enclensis]|uniref:AraC family transcriptional regulator n=1 Tax=Fictibacillus enclensis TaxID=1017270 RepID=UPI0024C006BC|nr:AraC family transcriptional regulator [Fictibacillus enclensis]WHY71818.1 AraC family transcriptional regulator [Fictibacillus enclensis]